LWHDAIQRHLGRDISERTWAAFCTELRWVRLCGGERRTTIITMLFERFPTLLERIEGLHLIARISDVVPRAFLESQLNVLRESSRALSRQAFGELLTLIAFRDTSHRWALDRLNMELEGLRKDDEGTEPVAIGIAFASARLWDELEARTQASRTLCRVIPVANERISEAVATVVWAHDNFAADTEAEALLQAFADHPSSLGKMHLSDLTDHLVAILPHKRQLVLNVCNAILQVRRQDSDLYEAGAHLVDIAMTLQRFSDTRDEGLSLLEELLRIGLDQAFSVLHDLDIRPEASTSREARPRRRRGR
jgi:hypothetical protein